MKNKSLWTLTFTPLYNAKMPEIIYLTANWFAFQCKELRHYSVFYLQQENLVKENWRNWSNRKKKKKKNKVDGAGDQT